MKAPGDFGMKRAGRSRARAAQVTLFNRHTHRRGPRTSQAQVTSQTPSAHLQQNARLELVAAFPDRQITGVAVSETGRILVSLPRWSADVPMSVGELKNGRLEPYPDAAWNAWRNAAPLTAADHFVCVQSVVAMAAAACGR